MNIEFPRFPQKHLSNDKLRSSFAKARANYVFYLEESEIRNDKDLVSALVTAEAHNMSLELEAEEYRSRAVRELAYCEGRLSDGEEFREELAEVRRRMER